MSTSLRTVVMLLFVVGFTCGFAGLVFPHQTAMLEAPRGGFYQFQRLHIFLFNLVAGGTILLWFTEGKRRLSWRGRAYLVVALFFSVVAFLNHYALAVLSALVLAGIVESVRIRRYPLIPVDLFRRTTSIAERFHHSAVLCLSLGLIISAGVMINNQYLHTFDFLYLLLDDFFLGFSFPFSLLTFALMFALMDPAKSRATHALGEASFWMVTIGVIVFFVFIVLHIVVAEIAMALILLGDVVLLFALFRHNSADLKRDEFLTSGMVFLVLTGVTGLAILLWGLYAPQKQSGGWNLLFQIHAYVSLYGWNLAGLAVVVRYDEFPLRLHDVEVIVLHWVTITLLAPMGSFYPVFALLALPAFTALVAMILFTRGHAHVASYKPDRAPIAKSFWRELE